MIKMKNDSVKMKNKTEETESQKVDKVEIEE